MLTTDENELLTRVGPGTRGGELLRRYWVPALLSGELPKPDCPPVRIKLLGEPLVAFRDTGGRVGILDEFCAHRLASLWLGRNEEHGLRCIYHGWKYNVDGNCVDQMNEPDSFADRIKIKHYPTRERGSVVWTYMGPPDTMPSGPDFDYLDARDTHLGVTRVWEECNWLQALEGGIDTSHAPILHRSLSTDASAGNPTTSPFVRSSAPTLEVDVTDYGYRYFGVRLLDEDQLYIRGYHFVMPFTQIRPNQVGRGDKPRPIISGHHWVPIDDHNCMVWNWTYSYGPEPLTEDEKFQQATGNGSNAVDWSNDFRSFANQRNSWKMDREIQRTQNFSGIPGTNTQDRAVQESMGPIVDRTQEHLGPADRAIVFARRLLMEAARDVSEGREPRGARSSTYSRIRAIDRILSRAGDWRGVLVPEMNPGEQELVAATTGR